MSTIKNPKVSDPPPNGATSPKAGPLRTPLPPLRPAVRSAPLTRPRFIGISVLIIGVSLLIGLLLPVLMRRFIHMDLAMATWGALTFWLRYLLIVGYWVFIFTAVMPTLLFAAWSYAGSPVRRVWRPQNQHLPFVSILIPAFNEQDLIVDAIRGALAQDYPDFEVIVIDDGSTDLTAKLAAGTAARVIRHAKNQGKAAALNSGLAVARGEVIVTNDADGNLDPKALKHLVAPLYTPGVGAVAGQVRLFHPDTLIRRFQSLEYAYSQGLVKQAQYATTGTVLIAPGPVSAFRVDLLRAMNGFPSDTLTEDFDLSLQILAREIQVAYEPRALAYTEAPRTDSELHRQRIRWGRGGLQTFSKHRRLLGNRRIGLLGLFWLPYTFLSWYATIPLTLLSLVLLLFLALSSKEPARFLAVLALFSTPVLVMEFARVTFGVLLSARRDLWLLGYAPLFLIYQKIRLDWFALQSLYHEWRNRPRTWNA